MEKRHHMSSCFSPMVHTCKLYMDLERNKWHKINKCENLMAVTLSMAQVTKVHISANGDGWHQKMWTLSETVPLVGLSILGRSFLHSWWVAYAHYHCDFLTSVAWNNLSSEAYLWFSRISTDSQSKFFQDLRLVVPKFNQTPNEHNNKEDHDKLQKTKETINWWKIIWKTWLHTCFQKKRIMSTVHSQEIIASNKKHVDIKQVRTHLFNLHPAQLWYIFLITVQSKTTHATWQWSAEFSVLKGW